MILQLAFVLTAIIIGARLGGIGLGVMGGVGLGILTFAFGLQPTAPPIDVMLMIAAVISAASCMQAAGGLDYMVKLAEKLLRKNPSHVTILSQHTAAGTSPTHTSTPLAHRRCTTAAVPTLKPPPIRADSPNFHLTGQLEKQASAAHLPVRYSPAAQQSAQPHQNL